MTNRVLHLIQSLGGGGAERQLSYLAPQLAALGEDIHIAHVTEGCHLARLEQSDCSVHKISCYGNHDPRLYLSISRLVKSLKPQLIQTWLPQMDVVGGAVAIRRRLPFIISERNTSLAYRNGLKSSLRRMVGSHAAAIVANSEQGLDYWSFVKGRTVRMAIRNGLPTDELMQFAKRRASTKPKQKPDLVVFAGRYMPAKNAELVLETFIEISRRFGNVNCQMFGEGVLERKLRRRIVDAGCAYAIGVNGYTDNLWEMLADASALVSLSANEGQPNVVLEAAAIGCPLVLSSIPAHREILGDTGALYVKELTPRAAADAVCTLLEDAELCAIQTDAAKTAVKEFSIRSSAAAYRALYDRLLKSE